MHRLVIDTIYFFTDAFDVIEPVGAPCEGQPGRPETIITLSQTNNANPPISLTPDRTVDFSEPFCIGLTASIQPHQTELLGIRW